MNSALANGPRFNGPQLGEYLVKCLGGEINNLRIIFCPGMGGKGHSAKAYNLWLKFDLWFDSWTDFAQGGQEYMKYKVSTGQRELLAGAPQLKDNKVEELCEMVRASRAPTVLFGFSAGAYLCLRAALVLQDHAGPLALLCCGHTLGIQDIWGQIPSTLGGLLIFGEKELKAEPDVWTKEGKPIVYDELDALGRPQLEDINSKYFGAHAGTATQCGRVSVVFPRCLLLVAPKSSHNLKDYDYALRCEAVRGVTDFP
jgi:pimeloyl-ACP methyl ester carboxylesterase